MRASDGWAETRYVLRCEETDKDNDAEDENDDDLVMR